MLKLRHPDRYLAAEPVEDLFVNFPILCAEHANVMSADRAFIDGLLIEAAVIGDVDTMLALQEGAVANAIDGIQAFFKSIVEFFKKLLERLRAAFLSNTQSIDKWKKMIDERYKANKKNASKYEYEGFKWNPGSLDAFRKNITISATDLSQMGVKSLADLSKQTDDYAKKADTFKSSAERLKDKEDKEQLKKDDTSGNAAGLQMDTSSLGDKIASKANDSNAEKVVKDASKSVPDSAKSVSDSEYEEKMGKGISELEKFAETEFNKKLVNDEDLAKGMEAQLKKIKGESKVTIKGFQGLSPDAMMAEISSYDEKSKTYLEAFDKVYNDYQEILNKAEAINFKPSKMRDSDKEKTSKYLINQEKIMQTTVNTLKTRQNAINTAANKSMTWHKEMVMDFMSTLTNFAMYKFS